jgi:NTP pyrophosphatase (non-canonical NTP hydrolase)
MARDISHSDMVAVLKKDGQVITDALTAEDADLWHMATGVAGEGGELLDAVKKAVVYRKPLDRENVIEELGDLEFFMEGVRQILNITREETLDHNIDKLGQRYRDFKYSDSQAQTRRDKGERTD